MRKFSSKMRGRSQPLWKSKGAVVAAVGLLVVAWSLPALISSISGAILYPFHVTRVWFAESSSSLPVYLREKNELINEIEELERSLAEISGAQASRDRLHSENQQLRSLLDLPTEEPRILGRVIARPTDMPYDVLQIDTGTHDGVVTGAPVYLGYDQVLGFVSFTTAHYSLVTLVTSPEQLGTAYVFGPNIFARTEGVGGGVLRIRIPQGVTVAEGDLAVLPAVNVGQFGAITHIETRPTEPQQYAFVPLPVSLQSIRYVMVGTNPIAPVPFDQVVERVATASSTLFTIEVVDEQLEVGTTTVPELIGLPALEDGQETEDLSDMLP